MYILYIYKDMNGGCYSYRPWLSYSKRLQAVGLPTQLLADLAPSPTMWEAGHGSQFTTSCHDVTKLQVSVSVSRVCEVQGVGGATRVT